MIIKSISLRNFQCYFGPHEQNKFNFKLGINLIIGDNASGKSKLFDAFRWVLQDKIFNSDTREFVPTKRYGVKLFADKAKKGCATGDQISAEVSLRLIDSNAEEYKIERIYTAVRTDSSWRADSESNLLVYERKGTRWQLVGNDRQSSILNRVIPPFLEPYMWFQGEQVDGLMDFQNRTSFVNAINILSDIKRYDGISEISEEGKRKAENAYTKAMNKLSKDKDKSAKLTKELSSVVEKIKKQERLKSAYSSQRDLAQSQINKLINQIADAEKNMELKTRRKQIQQEADSDTHSYNLLVEGLNKKLFTESWLLMDVQSVFDEYSKSYNEYYQAHVVKINAGKARAHKLPIDIPQPIHVSKMLEEEKCFVCGRDAKKDSMEYAHIEELLNREKEETKELFKNDCSSFFQEIYNYTLQYKTKIAKIDESIGNELNRISSLRSSIKRKDHELKQIDEQFDELLAEDKSEDVVKEFKTHSDNLQRYNDLATAEERTLDSLRKEQEHLKNVLGTLVVGNVDKVIASSNDIWNSLHELALATRKAVFSNLVSKLEQSSNEIFHQMTERNNSITGRIRLKLLSNEICVPEIVDNEGSSLTGSNDSNIILVKLALIMAIVTSRMKWNKYHTLISDAPTSKMAKNYADGFYSALSKNFKQSIVMTYDFLDENKRETLSNLEIGKVHHIQSEYLRDDREDRSDLQVRISEVTI